jgi:hypothetical protein
LSWKEVSGQHAWEMPALIAMPRLLTLRAKQSGRIGWRIILV